MQKILLIADFSNSDARDLCAGIAEVLGHQPTLELRTLTSLREFTLARIRRILADGTNGIIITTAYNGKPYDLLLESRLPIVVIDPSDEILAHPLAPRCFVRRDAITIGRAAAEFFLATRRYHSFAFIGALGAPNWSLERRAAFQARLAEAGETCARYEPSTFGFDRQNLAKAIKSLKKPVAIFAANDARAIDVMDVAKELMLSIPKDVSVLGVDNDEFVCTRVSPQLSSIEPDCRAEGRQAARALLAQLAGEAPDREDLVCRTLTIHRRGSTALPETPAEALVRKATDFIRAQATTGIGVEAVAKHFKVSRQLLNLRFREAGLGTVQSMLTEVRIAEAKRLLEMTDDKLLTITYAVGYESESHFKAVFRRHTGKTMSEWRHSHS